MLLRFIRWLNERPASREIEHWFTVRFDKKEVEISAKPPGKKSWKQVFPWESVERVCFKDERANASDGIYVFTSLRQESFVIPVEASGGTEFLHELVSKGLFPEHLMKEAALSTNGGFYCWPPVEPRAK